MFQGAPLCPEGRLEPGLPPEQSPQPGASTPGRLCPRRHGEPCIHLHAPGTGPSGSDSPPATPGARVSHGGDSRGWFSKKPQDR